MVEGRFILRNITQDNLRFYYVLGALPESAVRGLGDLMRGPPPPDAYQQLDVRLHHLQQGGSQERLSPDTHARK